MAVAEPVNEPDAVNDPEFAPISTVVSLMPITSSDDPTVADALFLLPLTEVPTLLAEAVCVLEAAAVIDASVPAVIVSTFIAATCEVYAAVSLVLLPRWCALLLM